VAADRGQGVLNCYECGMRSVECGIKKPSFPNNSIGNPIVLLFSVFIHRLHNELDVRQGGP
jgi:hypothetical protein